MIEFITGPSGSGKTSLMYERIKEDTLPKCIIVPEQFSHDFDKKLYYFLGAKKFNEVFSLSFTGLSRQLFQLFGDPSRGGEYADDMAKMILVYQAITNVEKMPSSFNYFRSGHSGFAEDVLKLIGDMKRAGIHPDKLLESSDLFDDRLKHKTSDIAMIYMEYQRLMEEYGFKDELDNITEAAKIANLQQYFKGMSVYIDEFESFTADQVAMLKVMILTAENVSITLRTDDITAGKYTLFEAVNKTYHDIVRICNDLHKEYKITVCPKSYRFKYPDLEYVSRNILRSRRYTPENAPVPENIRIFEARDMYSESEYVCASIKRLIHSDKKLRFRDIAVISNDIEKYSAVLKAAFGRYDIPYFLSLEKPVSHTAIIVYFTSLLDLLGSRNIKSEQVFRLLRSGLVPVDITDVSALENYCYKWSVDGEMWAESFTADDDGLETAETIRQTVIMPVIKLKRKLGKVNTAEKICTLLYDHLIESGAEKCVSKMMSDLIRNGRDGEAAEIKRLWSCLIDILDSIYDTIGTEEITFSEMSRLIKSMAGRINYSVPPQTLDAVMTASSRTARLNAPKVVFLIGTTDGDFPNQVTVHGLFSEADRQKLAEKSLVISTPVADLIASERLVVYKAMSAASEKLFITYPLSDLSGQAKYPAQAVDSVIKMFGNEKMRQTENDIPMDYYTVTFHAAFYHYMQERSANTRSSASVEKLLLDNPEYRRRLTYVLSRSSHTQEYKIDSATMEKLKSFTPLQLSATGMEEYYQCHFKYFCDKCLNLHQCEKVQLDQRIAGELAHECFLGFLSSRSKKEFIEMSYADIQGEINSRASIYRKRAMAGDFGKDAKFELIFNKLTDRMTEVFIHTQQSLMASDFVPHKFEFKLEETKPLFLPFESGKYISFGGIIDRADVCNINGTDYVRIIDYKSSRKEINAENLGSGINMQMLLYLFAATDKGGAYENCKPAGVLYSPVQVSNLTLEDHKIEMFNSDAVDSSLKTSGLVLSDTDVLNAMEKNIAGRYIPVKLDKSGNIGKSSECISSGGIDKLKEYVYRRLCEMAKSLYNGNVEAIPIELNNMLPCTFCEYINICDNSKMERWRKPDEKEVAEAQEILDMKTDGESEENGMD